LPAGQLSRVFSLSTGHLNPLLLTISLFFLLSIRVLQGDIVYVEGDADEFK
jgi:hypothetical protein